MASRHADQGQQGMWLCDHAPDVKETAAGKKCEHGARRCPLHAAIGPIAYSSKSGSHSRPEDSPPCPLASSQARDHERGAGEARG